MGKTENALVTIMVFAEYDNTGCFANLWYYFALLTKPFDSLSLLIIVAQLFSLYHFGYFSLSNIVRR